MEKLKRPVYLKAGTDDFFRKMRNEVTETVLQNSSLYLLNVIKSLGLLVLFFLFYGGILFFGNNTPLLFLFYILCGFIMIVLFINAFHDAAHGALFKKAKHNECFLYVLELLEAIIGYGCADTSTCIMLIQTFKIGILISSKVISFGFFQILQYLNIINTSTFICGLFIHFIV